MHSSWCSDCCIASVSTPVDEDVQQVIRILISPNHPKQLSSGLPRRSRNGLICSFPSIVLFLNILIKLGLCFSNSNCLSSRREPGVGLGQLCDSIHSDRLFQINIDATQSDNFRHYLTSYHPTARVTDHAAIVGSDSDAIPLR